MVLQPAPTLHGDPALTPLSAALSYKYREVQRWKIQNTFKSKQNVPTPKNSTKDAGVGYTVHPLLKTTEGFSMHFPDTFISSGRSSIRHGALILDFHSAFPEF